MQKQAVFTVVYDILSRRNTLSTKDFFADAGIGPDTRFCVHGLPTRYAQTIHSLLSEPPTAPAPAASKGAAKSYQNCFFQAA
jgi:hypothetical protein